MSSDIDRNAGVTGGDLLLSDVYRVNPADRDQSKSGQEQFREALEKKKKGQSGQDPPSEDQQDEDARDRVVLSAPSADQSVPTPPVSEPEESDPGPAGHIDIKA